MIKNINKGENMLLDSGDKINFLWRGWEKNYLKKTFNSVTSLLIYFLIVNYL